jgi:hypothetical protein
VLRVFDVTTVTAPSLKADLEQLEARIYQKPVALNLLAAISRRIGRWRISSDAASSIDSSHAAAIKMIR